MKPGAAPSAISHYAEAAERANHPDMETVYFHLVKGEPALPIGTPRQPPAGARVWTPQDWFALPSDRLFPTHAGDFQPRDTEGDVLGTADRLSIQAMQGQYGITGTGAWSEPANPLKATVGWIGSGPETATPVIEVGEEPDKAAMRNLPGKNGYGRARGTEGIDRPDNGRRVEALAILLKELAEGKGIDLVRNGPADHGPNALPTLLSHEDGGMEIRLGGSRLDRPSTVDLIEETTAVAIAIAWQSHDKKPASPQERLDRATVAGIIAAHELVQSAGIRCPMAPDHAEHVSKWASERRNADTPDRVATELNEATALAAATEWSLRLPSTPRQRTRWDRIRQQRDPAAVPAPITGAGENEAERPAPRRLATGQASPARPNVTTPAPSAARTAPAHSHATNTAQR